MESFLAVLIVLALLLVAAATFYFVGAFACVVTGTDRGRGFKLGIGLLGMVIGAFLAVGLGFEVPVWGRWLLAVGGAAVLILTGRLLWQGLAP